MAADAAGGAAQLIEVPDSPCISVVDGLGWLDQRVPVRAGRYVLGVRGNAALTQRLLVEVAGPRVVTVADDFPVGPLPRNLSLHLVADQQGRVTTRGLHRLHLGHRLVARSRDPRRLLHALDQQLLAHGDAHDTTLPQVAASVVVGADGALVLPLAMRHDLVTATRRLADVGLTLVDRCWVAVDTGTGEVVLPEPSPWLGDVTLDGADAIGEDRADPPVAPGRHRVVAWHLPAPASPGTAVVAAARSVVNLAQVDAGRTIAGLAALLGDVGDADVPALGDLLAS